MFENVEQVHIVQFIPFFTTSDASPRYSEQDREKIWISFLSFVYFENPKYNNFITILSRLDFRKTQKLYTISRYLYRHLVVANLKVCG